MIDIKDLTVKYGEKTALNKINLHILKNSTYAVIGPSGCGKTTLLYALAGLIHISGGSVKIKNEIIKNVRKGTGIVLQNLAVFPWKTVRQNIETGLKARKIGNRTINEKIIKVLNDLSITEHQHKYPDELSGGEKQRVALARTLVLDPDVILLDEASSALDAITKEKIQNLILHIYQNNPTTMVIVTHSIEEAVFLGQKIAVMDKGKIHTIIDNPHFGDKNIRTKSYFFNVCKKVRNYMQFKTGDPEA